jgi:hypothetical protein
MKIGFFYFKVFFIALIICIQQHVSNAQTSQESNRINQLTPSEIEAGWKLLFDGKTTTGWRNFGKDKMNEGCEVKDGNLVILGKGGEMGGDIVTVDQYEDFELYLEWAISPGGNSGIFFHVLEDGYTAPYETGQEYQLIDDVGFPEKLEDWQKAGADYAMHNADDKTLNPVGEFNSSKIVVKGGKVDHWLNEQRIVSYELWTEEWKRLVQNCKWKDYPGYGLARKGYIGLQNHGSVIKFRNIKIHDLTDPGISLFNGKDLKGWKVYGTEKWFVDDGLLVCESGPDKQYGYLTTEKSYKNFILRLQFKQESNGNSGVFFRSSMEGTKISGWQVEVAPPGNDSGGIYESYGRGWLWQIPDEKENILKMGEWNDLVIKVQGDRVMTWLNNVLMTDLRDDKIGQATGVIALQIHDGGGIKVKWRNISITEF